MLFFFHCFIVSKSEPHSMTGRLYELVTRKRFLALYPQKVQTTEDNQLAYAAFTSQ